MNKWLKGTCTLNPTNTLVNHHTRLGVVFTSRHLSQRHHQREKSEHMYRKVHSIYRTIFICAFGYVLGRGAFSLVLGWFFHPGGSSTDMPFCPPTSHTLCVPEGGLKYLLSLCDSAHPPLSWALAASTFSEASLGLGARPSQPVPCGQILPNCGALSRPPVLVDPRPQPPAQPPAALRALFGSLSSFVSQFGSLESEQHSGMSKRDVFIPQTLWVHTLLPYTGCFSTSWT